MCGLQLRKAGPGFRGGFVFPRVHPDSGEPLQPAKVFGIARQGQGSGVEGLPGATERCEHPGAPEVRHERGVELDRPVGMRQGELEISGLAPGVGEGDLQQVVARVQFRRRLSSTRTASCALPLLMQATASA